MSRENFTIVANFGERIRILREALKMTQAAFAENIGITGSYKTKAVVISRWERGERKPDSTYLTRMAINFKAGINWLLTGEGKMFMDQHLASRVAEAAAPYGDLTPEEREIIGILRENPELTGLCRKLLGGRKAHKEGKKAFREALADLQKTLDPEFIE